MNRIEKGLKENRILKIVTNRDLFSKIYISTCILWFFPLLGWLMDPISKICFLWGVIIILWDLVFDKKVIRASYWYLLLLFLFFYGLSVLFNYHDNLYPGIKNGIYSGIFLLILYVQNGNIESDSVIKALRTINKIVIYISFIASFVSIIMFLGQISFVFYQDDLLLRQGFLENRLFGVYTSPNTGALFAVVTVILMCIDSLLMRGSILNWSVYYKINGIIQIIYFSLTLSNGGILTSVALLFLVVIIFLIPYFCKKRSVLLSCILALVIFILSTSCLYIGTKIVQRSMAFITEKINYAILNEEENEEEGEEKDIKLVRIESGDDASNGRFNIWNVGLNLWKTSPVLGVADADLSKEEMKARGYDISSLTKNEEHYFFKCNGNLHNSYVQILVDSGILGIGCFVIFIFFSLKKYILFLYYSKTDTLQYRLVGGISCLLGALGVNGLVETHLLFNRQDPYGAIFWFYLGCGMSLINYYKKTKDYKDAVGNKRKIAFICDTPLQILNVVNFVQHNIMDTKENACLYLVHQFTGSENLSANLKKENIFNYVYDVKMIDYEKGIVNKIFTLKRMIFPGKCLYKLTGEKCKEKYRYLGLTFQSPFVILMRTLHSESDVILIEDGIGTYTTNIETDYASSLFKAINKYFFESCSDLEPISVYLNNPKLLQVEKKCTVYSLPDLKSSEESFQQIKRIFSYRERKHERKYIFLTQPLAEIAGYKWEKEQEILRVLKENLNENQLCIRLHPRQHSYDNQNISVERSENLWELECIDIIGDLNVLISTFSTSLCMPKLLCDKEPTLILLYKIIIDNWFDNERLMKYEAFIHSFSKLYNEERNVFIPETVEELIHILNLLN